MHSPATKSYKPTLVAKTDSTDFSLAMQLSNSFKHTGKRKMHFSSTFRMLSKIALDGTVIPEEKKPGIPDDFAVKRV